MTSPSADGCTSSAERWPDQTAKGSMMLTPAFSKSAAVARDDGQAVDEGGGGDQAVFDRHGAPGGAKTCEQLRPPQARFRFPRQTMKSLNAGVEPAARAWRASCPCATERMPKRTSPRMIGIDGDLALVAPEPLDHPGIGRRLGRLAQDVGVDQISHSVSVDSDSTGTKKPFSGQARSQSTTPSFGGGERRLSRYSPRSRRSTSNSWPASMRSCRRISAGNTIWPFDETVVFMPRKIVSYTSAGQERLLRSTARRWWAERSALAGLRAHARRNNAVAVARSRRSRGCHGF